MAYLINVKEGVTESTMYQYCSHIVDEMVTWPTAFRAELTNEQKEFLELHENISTIESEEEVADLIDDNGSGSKSITYARYGAPHKRLVAAVPPAGVGDWAAGNGNWGIARHFVDSNTTSCYYRNTRAVTQYNAPQFPFTYNYNYDGEGVDIIMNLASYLNHDDPGFKNSDGTTRLQFFQWNTLEGLGNLPDIPYTNKTQSQYQSYIDNHAEAVAYCACHNEYGVATKANIYVIARLSTASGTTKTAANGHVASSYFYEIARQFHLQKKAGKIPGVDANRPTIYLQSFSYRVANNMAYQGFESIHFRDTEYDPKQGAFGDTGIFGHVSSQGGNHMILPNAMFGSNYLRATDGRWSNATSSFIKDSSLIDSINLMHEAGVHMVTSAGNERNKLCLPDNIDYDNRVTFTNITAPGGYSFAYYTNRVGKTAGTHTIVSGALDNAFGAPELQDLTGGKERMAYFSGRGDRVDCCTAGEMIPLKLYTRGTQYYGSGTSFSCPFLAGMLALVLEKHPTTTPAQLRKYARDFMISTEKLYDPGRAPIESNIDGDIYYFGNENSLMGYSGNITFLDPGIPIDPTTITDTTITSPDSEKAANAKAAKINFSVADINTKLASI